MIEGINHAGIKYRMSIYADKTAKIMKSARKNDNEVKI